MFATLHNFNIWNLAPPDITHDLAEGVVVARALADVILKYCVTLSPKETVETINKFPFYNSKITVKYESESFIYLGTKAVQVMCKFNANVYIF